MPLRECLGEQDVGSDGGLDLVLSCQSIEVVGSPDHLELLQPLLRALRRRVASLSSRKGCVLSQTPLSAMEPCGGFIDQMAMLDALDPRCDRPLDCCRRVGVHRDVGAPTLPAATGAELFRREGRYVERAEW